MVCLVLRAPLNHVIGPGFHLGGFLQVSQHLGKLPDMLELAVAVDDDGDGDAQQREFFYLTAPVGGSNRAALAVFRAITVRNQGIKYFYH